MDLLTSKKTKYSQIDRRFHQLVRLWTSILWLERNTFDEIYITRAYHAGFLDTFNKHFRTRPVLWNNMKINLWKIISRGKDNNIHKYLFWGASERSLSEWCRIAGKTLNQWCWKINSTMSSQWWSGTRIDNIL